MKKLSIAKNLALALVALTLLLNAVWAGYHSFWTDSEMWAVISVRSMFATTGEYNGAVKPLLDFLLWVCFQAAEHLAVHPMFTARALFALNELLTVGLFFYLCRRLSQSRGLAFLITLLLVSNSFFIKRFCHVRSDLLITNFLLLLCWLQDTPRWQRASNTVRLGYVMLFTLVAITVTPKAVLPFALWTLAFARSELRQTFAGRRGLILIGAGLWMAIAYASWNWQALRFLSLSLATTAEHAYFGAYRFQHVGRFIRENAVILAVFAFNLYLLIRRAQVQRPEYFVFANLVLIELLFYPDRLPFFIAALIPFWLLPLSCAKDFLARILARRRLYAATPYIILVYGMINLGLWSYVVETFHTSDEQEEIVTWLEEARVPLSTLVVYDPVGLMPFSPSLNWFVGPDEIWNSIVLLKLEADPPAVIFFTMRLFLLGTEFLDFLQANYWSDGHGIFIRRVPFPTETTPFNCATLKDFVLKNWPKATAAPQRIYYLNALNKAGESLEVPGSEVWREEARGFRWTDLARCKDLRLPKDLARLDVLPARLVNPTHLELSTSFRFDPEY